MKNPTRELDLEQLDTVVGGAPRYHQSHSCPRCGREQRTINRAFPDGTHEHCCPCGRCWRHRSG